MKIPETPAASFAAGRSGLLQRKSDRDSAGSPISTEMSRDGGRGAAGLRSLSELGLAPRESRFGSNFADVQVHPGAQAAQHNGVPLDGSARRAFESRFQQDFSRVRVHTGSSAHAALQSEN